MPRKVPVTTRALVQRINRKLHSDDEMLKKARGERAAQQVGEYFLVDFSMNAILRTDVDPEELGRKLGVLHDYEEVVKD